MIGSIVRWPFSHLSTGAVAVRLPAIATNKLQRWSTTCVPGSRPLRTLGALLIDILASWVTGLNSQINFLQRLCSVRYVARYVPQPFAQLTIFINPFHTFWNYSSTRQWTGSIFHQYYTNTPTNTKLFVILYSSSSSIKHRLFMFIKILAAQQGCKTLPA